VSHSSEFCCHNPLCCFSTSVYCCKRIFRYLLSPETFGYTLVNGQMINLLMRGRDRRTNIWRYNYPLLSYRRKKTRLKTFTYKMSSLNMQ